MMKLNILSPSKKLLVSEEIVELFAPGVEGKLDILPGHANLVTELETGVLSWKSVQKNSDNSSASISYGWLEVNGEEINVLAHVAELSSDVDLVRAKDAEKRAREVLDEGGLDDLHYKKQQLKLQRAMSRQASLAQ